MGRKKRCAVDGCTGAGTEGGLCLSHAHQKFFAPTTFDELRDARAELGLSSPDGDRVSLYPMAPEDALRALLGVSEKFPFPHRDQEG